MRGHKLVLGLVLSLFILSACNRRPVNPVTPVPALPDVVAQGFLVGYSDGDDLTLDAVIETRDATGKLESTTLAESDYNGTFTLELGSVADTLLTSLKAVDAFSLQAQASDPSAQCSGDVAVSDESALATAAKFMVARKLTSGEEGVGEAILVERDPERAIRWLYLNKPTTVRGSASCLNSSTSETAAMTFDLSLTKGWNLLAVTSTVDGAKTQIGMTRVGGVQDSRWVVQLRAGAVLEVGPDAGTTPQNPKGTMGAWPAAELKGAVLVPDVADVLGRATNLIEVNKGSPIGNDGSFNLNMVDVPEELLIELNFNLKTPIAPKALLPGGLSAQAAACSGIINVAGKPTYQQATLDVFLDGRQVGSAQAGNGDVNVDFWYLNSPTTLDGTISCETENGTEIVVAQNLALVKGWNIILHTVSATASEDGTVVTYTDTWTRATSLPPSVGWTYEDFRGTEIPADEPQGGEDKGSTRDRLMGRLGQWPNLEGSMSVTFDPVANPVFGDPNNAPSGSYVVASDQTLTGADSSFVIDLPNFFETGEENVGIDYYFSFLDLERDWVEPRYSSNPEPGDPCEPGVSGGGCQPGDPEEPTPPSSCEGDFAYDVPGVLYYARADLRLWQGQLSGGNRIGNASALVGSGKIASHFFWMFVVDDEIGQPYADPVGSVTGQVDCQGDLYLVNMDLVQGWNIVRTTTATLDNGNIAVEWATVPTVPQGTEWLARVNAQ